MKIVWLGGVFTDAAVARCPAVAQAANTWSRGLLSALQKQGHQIKVFGHRPERVWPVGTGSPSAAADLDRRFEVTGVRYLNLPGIRVCSLQHSYWRGFRAAVRLSRPDIVLTYNPYVWNNRTGRNAKRTFGTRWVPVILDLDDPGNSWRQFRKRLRDASGFVFLSHWGYENQPLARPTLHLDGGADVWYGDEQPPAAGPKTLLYAGKYNDLAGAGLIAETVRKLSRGDLAVVLCGKGNHPAVESLACSDSRVRRLGYVTSEELHRQYLQAHAFLNVRPPDIPDNRMIFPSKLVHYLSYGRPVVSSWTPGLSPDYRRFLQVPEKDTAEAFADKINEVLNWSPERLLRYRAELKTWFVQTHTWEVQAKRLTHWINTEIIASAAPA